MKVIHINTRMHIVSGTDENHLQAFLKASKTNTPEIFWHGILTCFEESPESEWMIFEG